VQGDRGEKSNGRPRSVDMSVNEAYFGKTADLRTCLDRDKNYFVYGVGPRSAHIVWRASSIAGAISRLGCPMNSGNRYFLSAIRVLPSYGAPIVGRWWRYLVLAVGKIPADAVLGMAASVSVGVTLHSDELIVITIMKIYRKYTG